MISAQLPNGLGVVLSGIGHHFPSRIVHNSELAETLGIEEDWVVRHTGVSSRHWLNPGESMIDIARIASLRAVVDAKLNLADIDMIIGNSATARHGINPTTQANRYADIALPLQRALGTRRAACLDTSGMACASFLASSLTARGLIASTLMRHVLVVCVENPVPILSERHRNRTLFGSGASAAIWSRSQKDHISSAVLFADSQYYDAFDIDEQHKIIMRGKSVSGFAPGALASALSAALDDAKMTLKDIDWIIPHQGNINLIEDLITKLSLPREKVLTNIKYRGNTSSASTPSCLSEHVRSGIIRPGDRILTSMIGRGFTWGAMIFNYQERSLI